MGMFLRKSLLALFGEQCRGGVGWSLTVWENLEVVFSAVSISSADHLLAWLVNYNLKLVSMWFFCHCSSVAVWFGTLEGTFTDIHNQHFPVSL